MIDFVSLLQFPEGIRISAAGRKSIYPTYLEEKSNFKGCSRMSPLVKVSYIARVEGLPLSIVLFGVAPLLRARRMS